MAASSLSFERSFHIMRMRSSHDGDLSKRNMNSNAIVASLRKQRMFHFIDWWAFVLTIEWIGGLICMANLWLQTLFECRVGTYRVQQPPLRNPCDMPQRQRQTEVL